MDEMRSVHQSRMLKKAVQQGRSERGGEAYSCLYAEPQSDARTKLAAFFNILLAEKTDERAEAGHTGFRSLPVKFCLRNRNMMAFVTPRAFIPVKMVIGHEPIIIPDRPAGAADIQLLARLQPAAPD